MFSSFQNSFQAETSDEKKRIDTSTKKFNLASAKSTIKPSAPFPSVIRQDYRVTKKKIRKDKFKTTVSTFALNNPKKYKHCKFLNFVGTGESITKLVESEKDGVMEDGSSDRNSDATRLQGFASNNMRHPEVHCNTAPPPLRE